MIMEWIESGEEHDPNDLDNLVCLCRKCHQKKTTGIERRLLRGDVIGFISKMKSFVGEERTIKALSLYNLYDEFKGSRRIPYVCQ